MPESSDGYGPIIGLDERSRGFAPCGSKDVTDSANDGVPLAQRLQEHVRLGQAQTIECRALPLAGIR